MRANKDEAPLQGGRNAKRLWETQAIPFCDRDRNKTVIARRIMGLLRRIRPAAVSGRIGSSEAPNPVQPMASQQLKAQICRSRTVTANLLFVGSIPTGASMGGNDLRVSSDVDIGQDRANLLFVGSVPTGVSVG